MLIRLTRYRIITDRVGTTSIFLAGWYVETLWDDVDEKFVVHVYTSASDPTPTVVTKGPSLGSIGVRGRSPSYDSFLEYPPQTIPEGGGAPVNVIPFSFCDGTTLNSFNWGNQFPYASRVETPNSFACATQVCDLVITSVTSTPASDSITPDGTIEAIATSSNGPIKYSLDNPNFNYATEGQGSGLFQAVYPGVHVVTVKDALGCFAQYTITVEIPAGYGVKYRLQYPDNYGVLERIDIEERGYTGDIIEVKGSGDPFILNSVDTSLDKFTPVIPSDAQLFLINEESQGNFYFKDLFTQDDRKYRLKYYKDFGGTTPGMIPPVMEDIDDWMQSSPGSGPWNIIVAWTGLSVALNGNKFSTTKYTDYAFEPGKTYSFSYNFGVTGPSGVNGRGFSIIITNTSFTTTNVGVDVYFPNPGNQSGVFTFVAPLGAERITISAFNATGNSTMTINDFQNITEPEGEQPVGFELKWVGFLISQNYKEAYLPTPYDIGINATDGLADLQNVDFLDSSGNVFVNDMTLLDVICAILKKTDLGINVQSAVNRYEQEMDTSLFNDPLNQCRIDPTIFISDDGTIDKCIDVLTKILKPFGAKIKQRNAKWFIYCTEEIVHEMKYREFNQDGAYVLNSSVDDSIDIKIPIVGTTYVNERVAFRDGLQVLEVIPAFGKFYLNYLLQKNPSLVKSYSFETIDTYQNADGLLLLRNWNVNINKDAGATFGIKQTKAFQGEYNFFYKTGTYGNILVDENFITLTAAEGIVEYSATDDFEFSFAYAVILALRAFCRAPSFVRIKWMLKVGDYYYSEAAGGWTADADMKYNDHYVTSFNQNGQFKIVSDFRAVTELTTEPFQVEFILYRENNVDFDNADDSVPNEALKALETTKRAIGNRINGYENNTRIAYYELSDDIDADGAIFPDDYNSPDNEKVWLKTSQIASRNVLSVDYIYIDNVVLKHLPGGSEAPESITIESINNPLLKVNFEDNYVLNDIDIDNINNSERTYKNYFKRLDGTPTQVWERTYRPGSGKILDLLTNDIKSQYRRGSNKITGTFDVDREIFSTACLREVTDNNRKYMFQGFTIHTALNQVDFDIAEVIDVVTDDESPDIDAGFTIGFTLGYRS